MTDTICLFCGLSEDTIDRLDIENQCDNSVDGQHYMVAAEIARDFAPMHLVPGPEPDHFRQPGKDEYGNRVPQDSEFRKQLPVFDGLFDYFPDALAYVSLVSLEGAEKHCEGRLGWNRDVSTDHLNCVARHLLDIRGRDPHSPRKLRHAGMAIWRLLAYLQTQLEEAKARGESWV